MASDRTNVNVRIAVTASVVFHLVVCLLALPAMLRAAAAMAVPADSRSKQVPESRPGEEEDGDDSVPIKLKIQLPEFVEIIERPEVRHSVLQYLRTTQSEPEEAPERAAFQSDRNTNAASELPPSPDVTVPLPTQQGADIPVIELASREYADGKIAEDRTLGDMVPEADPSATASPAEAQLASPLMPSPLAPIEQESGEDTPEPGEDDEFAEEAAPRQPEDTFAEDPDSDLLVARARRPLAVFDKPRETEREGELTERKRPRQGVADAPREPFDPLAEHRPPSPVAPALRPGVKDADLDLFQPQTRKNEIRGMISNRGSAAADTVDTPLGRYMRKVTSAIEKEWNRKRVAKSDFVTYGNIRLRFQVNRKGKVEGLKIVNRDGANAIMQDFTLSAVLEAPIPPIPTGLLPILEKEKLPVTYDIIIY